MNLRVESVSSLLFSSSSRDDVSLQGVALTVKFARVRFFPASSDSEKNVFLDTSQTFEKYPQIMYYTTLSKLVLLAENAHWFVGQAQSGLGACAP